MKKDDFKTLFVVLIISIICASLVLLLNYKKNSDKLENVRSNNMYFMAINYVNYYVSNVSSKKNKIIYDILNDKYIEKNNINENNVFDIINNYPNKSFAKVKEMKFFEVKNHYVFYIYGIIYQDNYNSRIEVDNNFGLILIIDRNNNSFSVYPTNSDNYKNDINKLKIKNIVQNDNNKLLATDLINKEKMCIFYMTDFINNIYNSDDKGYSLISEKMKEKYTTIDSYKIFINNNINKISTVADKCLESDGTNGIKTYNVIDTNGNRYSFVADGVMNYTVDIKFNSEESD